MRIDFLVTLTADQSEFLQPLKLLIKVNNFETILAHYGDRQDKSFDHSLRFDLPGMLQEQINKETELSNFAVLKYFFNDDTYQIKFYDAEEYTLFKMAYYKVTV